MKILIADKFEAVGVEQLKGLAESVVYEPGLKPDAMRQRVAEVDPDVLVVRSAKVNRDAVEAGKRLRLIVRAGSGVDTIDVGAASQRGVMVSNCPGQNAVAVAELTFGLILSLDRKIPDNVAALRQHKWNKKEFTKGPLGLKGRTLGIVGAGRIGTEVARRAIAFEMKVLYYHLGRNLRLVDFPSARRAELDDLVRQSDVLSIHVPGGESTKGLIDARRIGLMKKDALLINTSRADVVDQDGLVAALKEGRIRGAGLDVFWNEPPADGTEFPSPIADLPNLYGTHHVGASTEQAQMAVAEETVRIVQHYKQSGKALNCVNMQSPGTTSMLVVRLMNKPGSLARVFQELASEEINVEEMDHVIYDGGRAACAHIRISKPPSDGLLKRLDTQRDSVLGTELIRVD